MLQILIFHKPTTTELRIVLWDDIGVYEPYNLSSCARNERLFPCDEDEHWKNEYSNVLCEREARNVLHS
jgi:hypothetical protein